MDLVALSVALLAFFAAGLAYREASRSSARKQRAIVAEAIEESERVLKSIKRDWEEERDRLVKQARRTGHTLKRLDEVLDASNESAEGSQGEDAGGGDARGVEAGGVRPMHQNVVNIPWRGGRTG